jgi:hypothetical protein
MRVLAGAVCRQDPGVLKAHLYTMLWQETRGVDVDLCYIDDSEGGSNRGMLEEAGARVLDADPRPPAADYGVDESGHQWAVPTFYHLAEQKQRILDLAIEGGYDAVFLVDTDLLLAPDTLQSLIDSDEPITSAVFWTKWDPQDPELPQVWQRHPYGFDGAGWDQSSFLRSLQQRRLVQVRGLGACTFIRADALMSGAAYWPLVEGLPNWGMWQGEDRHFCVRAERLHIPMYADAWPEVWHCFRPSQRVELDWQLERLAATTSATVPLSSDLVSFTVEPCEEPNLVGAKEYVRGRLRDLEVVEAIRTTLHDMIAGEERFVRAEFPADWPLEAYRGQLKILRVKLLGIHP